MPVKAPSHPTYQPKTRAEWRAWLTANHAITKGVRLVLVKQNAGLAGITYAEAIEEALCFGWIDGKANTLDDQRYQLQMSPRRPGSVWSKINKQRIRRLVAEGLMTQAGLAKIAAAKKDRSWQQLDAIDRLVIPADLRAQLAANAQAGRNFEAFSASSKKIILFWIASAKRDEARQKRIAETVRLAAQNIKAAHYRPGPKGSEES